MYVLYISLFTFKSLFDSSMSYRVLLYSSAVNISLLYVSCIEMLCIYSLAVFSSSWRRQPWCRCSSVAFLPRFRGFRIPRDSLSATWDRFVVPVPLPQNSIDILACQNLVTPARATLTNQIILAPVPYRNANTSLYY